MPNYIAKADILEVLENAILLQLTDDEGDGTKVDERVNAAIDKAEGEINAYCGSRYTVPLSPVTKIVSGYSVDMAIYHLYARRLGAPDHLEKRYENALKFFKDVSSGKATLGANAPLPTNSSHSVNVSGNGRIFDRDNMGGF